MRLVSKSQIARFSNQTFSYESMMELMGRQPYHIGGYIRLKKQYSLGLLSITEALGNVYMEEQGYTKLKDIDTVSFTWDVEVSQVPTVRISRATTATGSSGLPFDIYTQKRYFAKYDVAALENTQLLYFLSEGERVTDGFKYSVQTMTGTAIDTTYTAKNKTLRYVYNAHPEFSEYGTTKHHYNTERHINYMTKIRADQDYSGDFRAMQDLFFMTDADIKKATQHRGGAFKIFKLSSIEQQVLDHFLVSANGALLFGRSTIDESTGRPRVQVDGTKNIIAGDGIIPQFERYAYYIDYTEGKLNVKDFQDAIENIADKRGQSQGNHITVICNRRFSRHKADALQSAINTFAASNNGTWFFSRDTADVYGASNAFGGDRKKVKKVMPQEIAVGSTFNTYIYEGNTITFVVDESLTNHYRDRGYAIFIDTGIYEDETGQVPAVHLKTLKGRALIKSYITGIGGSDGVSDGQVSHRGDYSTFAALGWRGACVRNPMSATIMVESV